MATAHFDLDIDADALERAANILGTEKPAETVNAALVALAELTATVERLERFLGAASGDQDEYDAALAIFDAKRRD